LGFPDESTRLTTFVANKQKGTGLMTIFSNINKANIILLFLLNHSFKEIGFTYKLNYHIMTVLIGLYLHTIIFGNYGVRISNLVKFIGYYDNSHLRRSPDKLIECRIVRVNKRLYYLTKFGFSAVKSKSDRSEKLVYDFCNINGVEL
jgi:hypothetical protein